MLAQAMITAAAGAPFEPMAIELDDPRPDELLVRIVAAGMCQTDLHVRDQHFPYPLPCLLGHEGAGIVIAAGGGVTDVAPGDHVVLTFNSCGVCHGCRTGHPAYCSAFRALNFAGARPDGSRTIAAGGRTVHGCFFSQSSFATHALAHRRNAVRIDRDLPLAIMAPLGCGIQTGAGTVMNVLTPGPGASIAIFGAGAVGLSALLAAKLAGCARMVAVDRIPSRLALARELGATQTIDASDAQALSALTAAGEMHYTVETTGAPMVIRAAIDALAFRGTCALIGAPQARSIELDLSQLGRRTVTGVIEGDSTPDTLIPRLAALYREGRFPIDRMIRCYDHRDINRAAEDARSGAAIKPVLLFGDDGRAAA